jgi:hypothetical protein
MRVCPGLARRGGVYRGRLQGASTGGVYTWRLRGASTGGVYRGRLQGAVTGGFYSRRLQGQGLLQGAVEAAAGGGAVRAGLRETAARSGQ